MAYIFSDAVCNVVTTPARLVATSGVSVLHSAATRPALSVANTGTSNAVQVRTGAFHDALVVGPASGAGAGNVGIGTATALTKLHVVGAVCATGASAAVGIGTTAPTAALHVVGDARFAGAAVAGENFAVPDGLVAAFTFAGHLGDVSGCNVFGTPTFGTAGAAPTAATVGTAVQYNPSGRAGVSLVGVNAPGVSPINTVTYPVASAAGTTATGARPVAAPTADLPSPTGATGFSVAAWIKPYGTASASRQFALGFEGGFGASLVTSTPILAFGMEPTTNYAVAQLQASQGNYATVTTGTALALNAWTHVAVVLSGSALSPNATMTLYINGAATGTPQSYTHSSATPAFVTGLTLFNAAAGATNAFGGELDAVAVYKRPLTAAEVATLAAAPSAEGSPAIATSTLRVTGPLQLSPTTTLQAVATNSSNAATTVQLTSSVYEMRELSGRLAAVAAANGLADVADFTNGSVAPVAFGPFPTTAPTEGSLLLDPNANTTGAGSYFTTGVSASAASAFAVNWWQTGGFTAEAHVYAKTLSDTTPSPIVAHATPTASATATSYWSLQIAPATRVLTFAYTNGSPVTVSGTTALSSNTWYHVAVSCDTTNIRLFVNGALEATAAVSGTPLVSYATTPIVVGQTLGVNAFSGYLANVRLVGFNAVYTAAFTAPTTPLPVSGTGATLLLLRAAAFARTPLQLATQDGGRLGVAKISGPPRAVGASGARIYPPVAMTGYLTNLTASTVTYGRGYYIASASSEGSASTTPAWNAFGAGGSWETLNAAGYLYNASSPYAYLGNARTTDAAGNSYAGEWLQLQLPSAIVPTAFLLTGTSGQTTRAPGTFVALGSRDGATWAPIAQHSGVAHSASPQLFTVTAAQSYSYFRLVVQNLTGSGQTLSLNDWVIYGTPEALNLTSDGRVGIGVAAPTSALEVAGDALVNGNLDVAGYNLAPVSGAPHVPFNGSQSHVFLKWLQRTTSTLAGSWWQTPVTPRYSTILAGTGSLACGGGVLLPDGRVLFVPRNSTTIGLFNPTTNTYSTYTGGPGNNAHIGGVLVPDGRVVLVPTNGASIGIFNTTTNTYSTINVGTLPSYAYLGGVLLPDGRVVFVPYNATTIGIFNPATNAYSTIGGMPGGNAYGGGVLLPDGRVLFVPGNATTIGIFNPATNTYSTIGGMPGGPAYLGGVLVPDGRVVFVSRYATTIGIFNPATNAYSTVGGMPGNESYAGGVLLADGRVVFVPLNATTVVIFNPATNTYSTIGGMPGGAAYEGGVLLPDGRVVFVPTNASTIGILSGFPAPPRELCYHPCFNKY